jgi:hypothetical protein
MRQGCIRELRLDAITASSLTGYDRANAADVFAEYERLARACDLTVAEWGASMNGLRSLTRGTLAPGASCQPAALDLVAMNDTAAAHLFACTDPEEQACLPSATSWSCNPRSAKGGACFMDMNCLEGLFCTNSKALRIQGGTCNVRKDNGASCDFPSDCASLACKSGTCAPRDRQTIFCLQ